MEFFTINFDTMNTHAHTQANKRTYTKANTYDSAIITDPTSVDLFAYLTVIILSANRSVPQSGLAKHIDRFVC